MTIYKFTKSSNFDDPRLNDRCQIEHLFSLLLHSDALLCDDRSDELSWSNVEAGIVNAAQSEGYEYDLGLLDLVTLGRIDGAADEAGFKLWPHLDRNSAECKSGCISFDEVLNALVPTLDPEVNSADGGDDDEGDIVPSRDHSSVVSSNLVRSISIPSDAVGADR